MAARGFGRTARRSRTRILVLLLSVLGALAFANAALAGGPAIGSDQADYEPGSTVTLTGSGWGVGESVHVTVDDTLGQTWTWASNPDPMAGLDGSFTVTLTLPNTFIANYTVNANGASGAAATTTFTDGNATSVSGTVTDSVTHNAIAGATVTCDASGGCNATLTTTTNASGAYVFSSGNKLTFAGNGPTTLTLSVSKAGYSSGTIVLANVNNGATLANKDVALTPAKTNQAPLSIIGPGSATFGSTDQPITTAGGSGTGAITFSAAGSTACSISGSNLHVTSGTGTCSISATKAGDANFNPATSAPFSVTIGKAPQTIAFTSTAPASATVGGAYQPTANGGGSGNAVTFGATGACAFNGGTQVVTMTSVGTCTVTADQLGNTDYTAAAQRSQSFPVGKGNQTIAVTTHAPTSAAYNAQFTVAATASSGLTVAYSSAGSCTNSGATFTMTSGTGSCTVKYDQTGDANWNEAVQAIETVAASKASASIAFVASDLAQVYDGAVKTVGVTTTPSGLSEVTLSYSQTGAPATPKDAGSYTVTASLDNPNYAAAPIGDTLEIAKAASTTTVTCPTGTYTYDGSAHTPCSVSVTGVGGLDLSPGPDYTSNTNAGTATASYTFTGDANHEGSDGSATFTIDKASSTTTVTCPTTVTYTGSPLEPCTVSVTGAGGLHLTPDPDYSDNTDAGTATASYTYAGDANHEGSDDSVTFTVGKAGSSTAVTCPVSVTYTGSPLEPCTVSVTGAGGLQLTPDPDYSSNTDAGTATASYHFAGDANHDGSEGSAGFTIDRAESTTTVSCTDGPFTYDGHAQTPCTVLVTGAGGLSLTADPTYADNVHAGTASASYSFAGDANHEGSHGTATFTIGKADLTVTADPASSTYGQPAPASIAASVSGFVNGEGESLVTGVPDCSITAPVPTNAGVYPQRIVCGVGSLTAADYDFATFVTGTYTVHQAHLTVTADPVSITYGDSAPDASTLKATTTGFVNGDDKTVVSGNAACSLQSPLPVNASTYDGEIVCGQGTLAADNYDFQTFVPGTYTIEKAHLTVTADAVSIIYGESAPDASTLTASLSGFVNHEDRTVVSGKAACSLQSPLPVNASTYDGEIVCGQGTLAADNYDFRTFVPGTYTIEKAHLTVTADTASSTYGGPAPAASTLTATITGFVNHEGPSVVSGAADCSLLDPVPTDANVYAGEVVCARGTLAADNYDFPNGNFVAGTYTIRKADSVTTVTCPATVTFTGSALTPCTVSVTGAGGLDNTPAPIYTDNTNAGTASAGYSYEGDANHKPSSDSATFTIDKADSTTKVSCLPNVTYTGSALTPCTVSVNGAGGLSGSPTPTYSNNTNAGTGSASYVYAGDANHYGSNNSATFTIDKADSTTKVICPASVTYTGAALVPCAVSVTGAGGLSLAPDPSYVDNTSAGTGTASYTYAGDANHNGSSDSTTFTIDKAPSTTAVSCPTNVSYTATAQTPCTASVTGAGSLSQALTVTYASNTGVGTATATAGYAGDPNHTGSTGSSTFKIVYGSGEVQFLQPINGTAHNLSTNPDVSTFKAGSTVPVKVQVKLPNGTIVHPASAVWLTPQKGGSTSQTVDETVYTDLASSGVNYGWDSSGLFYQYNWGTPKTGGGFYYLIGVKLDDGQTYTVYISLR